MKDNYVQVLEKLQDLDLYANVSCDYAFVPVAVDYIESLGIFGVGLISIGSILSIVTLYLAVDAAYNILFQKESTSYKTNSLLILSVYPIASLCSFLSIVMPRAQLLSEAVTQISLTISLYRLFLLLIDVGRRNVTKSPPLTLKVGPCCCWPCLPFPTLDMTNANLSWLRVLVLQLPVIQGITYCIFLFLSAERPIFVEKYGVFLQPVSVTSILLGIYGLTVTTKSLQNVAPEANLHRKTMVSQMVLLFSKLQGLIVKSLPNVGAFPCNPPLTPKIYANVTYNALMLIEMLLLCYVARLLYMDTGKQEDSVGTADKHKDKAGLGKVMNNNETKSVQLPIQIATVTA